MIHELYANDSRFRPIEFKEGLNVVLADTAKNNPEDSRNGLGKTTLVNIIHFCLGSSSYRETLPTDKLKGWEFTITLDLFNEKIIATRSLDNPSQIRIEGNCKNFPIKPENGHYSQESWKRVLEESLFGFSDDDGLKYRPSFAMLSHYFIRKSDDFKSAFNNKNTSYKPINQKTSTSFLLGLNWKLISRHKELKDESAKLTNENSRLKETYGSKGRIIPETNRLAKEIGELEEELDNFKIHKSYDSIKDNADRLTEEIHDLINESVLLEKKLKRYEESLEEENVSKDFNLTEIYENSNFIFNDKVANSLENSEKFHKEIIRNRKEFLKNEMNSIASRLEKIETEKAKKASERARYMDVLSKFGALKEYTQLQELLLDKRQRLNELESIIEKFDEITSKRRAIKNELLKLESEFQINYTENEAHLNRLIDLFSDNSSRLYEYPGNLIIECSDKGFDFNIEIPKINSDGKSKMTIFCYDMMLLESFAESRIDFLVHDSNVFDGVDSRQIGSSLNLANEKGLQYICMINSDIVPEEYLTFDIEDNVVLRLSDDSIAESLLGFEF